MMSFGLLKADLLTLEEAEWDDFEFPHEEDMKELKFNFIYFLKRNEMCAKCLIYDVKWDECEQLKDESE
jgi:hypothetical protein